MNKRKGGQMDRWADRNLVGQMNLRTDEQTDRNGQTDRNADQTSFYNELFEFRYLRRWMGGMCSNSEWWSLVSLSVSSSIRK